jgi:probable rRNA maturation factor
MALQKIKNWAKNILNALDNPEAELSIMILDDFQISELNSKYLNRSGPTNVIAFPMRDNKFKNISPNLLGDVVISSETTFRECEAAGINFEQRFVELLLHGILHLLGYDHEQSEEEAALMEAKSREVLKHIGMG